MLSDTNVQTNTVNRISIEQLLFDLFLVIMLLVKGLGLTDGAVYKCGILTGFLLVACKILIGRYNVVQRIGMVLLAMLAGVCWFTSKDLGVPMCMALVLSMKGIRKRHAFAVGAVTWTFAFVVQILTQLLNLRARDFVVHIKFGGYLIRWALGYSHPNVLQISYAALVFYWFYLLRTNNKQNMRQDPSLIVGTLLSFCGAVYIFLYSLSTTGTLMYLSFMVVLLYCEWNRRRQRLRTRVETAVLEAVFPVAVLLSVAAPMILTGKAFDLVNRIVNNRLALSKYYLQEYGITLLGRDFSYMPSNITLDCSYMYLLMHDGLLVTIVMVVGYLFVIHRTLREEQTWENSVEIAMLMSYAVTAMSEPFAFNTSFKNVTLILVGSYLYRATERYGEAGGWLPGMSGIGARSYAIPDIGYGFAVRCRQMTTFMRRHLRAVILVVIVAACVAGIGYSITATSPTEVLARRSFCDTTEESVSLYYSQEDIKELQNDPDVLVLNYKDAEDPMLSITADNLFVMERFRGMVSSCLWGGVAGLVFIGAGSVIVARRGDLRD